MIQYGVGVHDGRPRVVANVDGRVVDLSRVQHLSSTAVASFLWAHRICRARGGTVVLRGANRRTLDLLRRTGLWRVLRLEATSGRDLGTWSKKWLETAGVNTLSPEIRTNSDGTITFNENDVLDSSAGDQGPEPSDPSTGPGGQLDLNDPNQVAITFLGESTIDGIKYYYYGTADSTVTLPTDL